MSTISEILKNQLLQFKIPFKENQQNLIIKCPVCYYKDGKEKIKLYIHKETGVFHCFRCNIKGSLHKLIKLLTQYYKIDLTQFLSVDDILRTTYNIKYLSQVLENIDKETVINTIQQIKRKNQTLHEIYKAISTPHTTSTNLQPTTVHRRVYGYLLKRNIPITLLKYYPYFIGTNPQSQLYYRFGVSSFFYTNYEARAVLNGQTPRYLQSSHRNTYTDIDFIFFPPMILQNNHTTIKQLSIYNNPTIYTEQVVEFETLFIVEGLFDALKLNMYLNYPVISLGGWSKYRNSLLFLCNISHLFKKFTIKNLVFLFDKDISDVEIIKVADTVACYKSYLPFVDQFMFKKFNVSEKYKDVGDVCSPDELKHLLKLIFQ